MYAYVYMTCAEKTVGRDYLGLNVRMKSDWKWARGCFLGDGKVIILGIMVMVAQLPKYIKIHWTVHYGEFYGMYITLQ